MDLLSSFFDHHNKELGTAILPRRSAVRKKLIPCVHVRHSTRNTTQMAIIPTLTPSQPTSKYTLKFSEFPFYDLWRQSAGKSCTLGVPYSRSRHTSPQFAHGLLAIRHRPFGSEQLAATSATAAAILER